MFLNVKMNMSRHLDKLTMIKLTQHGAISKDKRRSLQYSQISGFIPEQLLKNFKAVVGYKKLQVSEAIEQAIVNWLKNN